MKKLLKIFFLTAFILLTAGCTFDFFWSVELFEEKKVVELGDSVSVSPADYLEGNNWSLSYATVDASKVDIGKTGSYSIQLTHGWEEYEVVVEIVDTTAPIIMLNDVPIYRQKGVTFPISDLYKGVSDISGKVTIKAADGRTAFLCRECGEHTIELVAEDASGNTAAAEVSFIIDTPPKIEGMTEYYMAVDTTTDFLAGVTATDEVDGDLTSSIVLLDGELNLSQAGDYTVFYEVTDKYGLRADAKATVHVYEKDVLETKISDRELSRKTDIIVGADNLYDAGSKVLDSVEEQMKYMEPTVVHIFFDYPESSSISASAGSGFIIDIDEEYVYICSNRHVLGDSQYADGTVYFFDSSTAKFEYLGGSSGNDTAIARIKKSDISQETLEQLMFVHIDTEAFAEAKNGGKPLFMQIMGKKGLRYTRTGKSTHYRSGVFGLMSIPMLESSVPVVSGNSGSAILDYEGNLICMACGVHGSNGVITYHNVGLEHIIATYEDVTGNELYKE